MSFLYPLYLLGALAIILPILMHLRRRPPKEKVPFSSLIFLEKTPEQLTRRTKLEHWLLLLLRCLALLALAMVFGRPFLKSSVLPSELPSASAKVILIDRSASMRREDLFEQAIEIGRQQVSKSKAADDVIVMFFDRDTEVLIDSNRWQDIGGASRVSVFDRLTKKLSPSWDVSIAGKALISAVDQIELNSEKEYREKVIHLISDFKEGSAFDSLNQFAWPEDIVVSCHSVSPDQVGNFSLSLAAISEGSTSEITHRVRITNTSDAESDRYQLYWNEQPDVISSGVLPPGSSRVVTVPANTSSSELILKGDAHDYDNKIYIAPPSPVNFPILYLSSDSETSSVGSPFYYFKRALHTTPSLSPSIEAVTFTDLKTEQIDRASALVLHGNWSEEIAIKCLKAAQQQGKLIIALPDETTQSKAIGDLIDVQDVTLAKANLATDYALLSDLDFDHPILQPFARAKIRDFTKIRHWKHLQLTLPEQAQSKVDVLANFDSGSPAWVSIPKDKGSIFLFLSGWQPDQSQFARSSKFVPIIYSIFENAGYSAKSTPSYYIGNVEILNDSKDLEPATKPGLFQTRLDNDVETQIAVNLPPSESRTVATDPNHLLRGFSIPLTSVAKSAGKAGDAKEDRTTMLRKQQEEKESKQKFWKWLVLAVVVFLIAETWLSGRRAKSASILANA